MRLRLMQTDAHGIRRETRRGDIARLCRRPNAQQNRIQFFELWLNAKLRHGNTVVLKIRNARGQIKELRILDWSRVEPLVADDGEVFYRITPDAQTMTSLPGCMREVTDCGLSFLSDVKSC